MRESGYQSKIIKDIEAFGGHCVNGQYTKAGEADLQAGIPVTIKGVRVLVHIAIEVKTPENYERVMRGVDENYNIVDARKLKKHEPLQMTKIRLLREKGGLAIVAYNFKQVIDYIKGVL